MRKPMRNRKSDNDNVSMMKLITNISENKRIYDGGDMEFCVQEKGYVIKRIHNIEVLKERKNKVDPGDSYVTKMG